MSRLVVARDLILTMLSETILGSLTEAISIFGAYADVMGVVGDLLRVYLNDLEVFKFFVKFDFRKIELRWCAWLYPWVVWGSRPETEVVGFEDTTV